MTRMEAEPKPTAKPFVTLAKITPWLIAFFVIEGLVAFGVFHARQVLVNSYDTPQAQTDWETWKGAAKEMGEKKTGLIQRREPKATEPPGLILMRDYFPQIVTLSVVLSGVLVGMTMLMVYGIVHQPPPVIRED